MYISFLCIKAIWAVQSPLREDHRYRLLRSITEKIVPISHQLQTETEGTKTQIATELMVILGINSYKFKEAEKAKLTEER